MASEEGEPIQLLQGTLDLTTVLTVISRLRLAFLHLGSEAIQ